MDRLSGSNGGVMVGAEALRRVVQEIEARAHRLIDEDPLRARLSRDLARARLYAKAVQSGYGHLIPERLYRELVQRYRPAPSGTDLASTHAAPPHRRGMQDAPPE